MKDIKHIFIPHVSTKGQDKEEKWVLFQSLLEKIEKQLENRKFESSKVDDSLQHHGFNLGPRKYFTPNIDMRNFYGKDPITWNVQKEQFFDLRQVPTLQNVTIAPLYLESDQFVWYQWICDHKKESIISWSIFTEELITHYGDINRNTLFSQLINVKLKGPIIEHIKQFQKLSLRVKNILEGNCQDLFMGTLKENIQHEIHIIEPKSLENYFSLPRES